VDGSLDYNFKGIIAIPARALKGKKIFVSSLFLLAGLILYDIIAYLALVVDGYDFAESFNQYGFLPFSYISFNSPVAFWLYNYIAPLLAIFVIAVGIISITQIDFENLRGNPFFSYKQAISYGFGRIQQLFLSWLTILVFILLIVLLGVIVGLIARIPYLGEFLYSIFFFFPNFIIALLTVFIILVFILSVLIMPAAVSADRVGESFQSILETFLTFTRQPVRWVLYTAYSLAAAKVASFILAWLSFMAVQFLHSVTWLGGGDKITGLIASGARHLPLDSPAMTFMTNIFPGLNFGFDLSLLPSGGTDSLAGYIMTASLFLIFLMICGYFLSVIATGQAYAFAVIKKMRDDHKITDEKPLFYREEWANPPIDENKKDST
jgi:hypothetical protein